jgi:hypothetical protein
MEKSARIPGLAGEVMGPLPKWLINVTNRQLN